MSEFRILNGEDTSTATEIARLAYEGLRDIYLPGMGRKQPRTPQTIGDKGYCIEASDAATRAAHRLGVMASREKHSRSAGVHYITSFSETKQLPTEDDPIMCLTWGQFNQETFNERPTFFFGPRRDMQALVEACDYRSGFSADSVSLRQTTHALPRESSMEHVWLKTTPEDLVVTDYPMGLVGSQTYTRAEWEFPVRLLASDRSTPAKVLVAAG